MMGRSISIIPSSLKKGMYDCHVRTIDISTGLRPTVETDPDRWVKLTAVFGDVALMRPKLRRAMIGSPTGLNVLEPLDLERPVSRSPLISSSPATRRASKATYRNDESAASI